MQKLLFLERVRKKEKLHVKWIPVINDLGGVFIIHSPQEVKQELRCPSQTGCHLKEKERKWFKNFR